MAVVVIRHPSTGHYLRVPARAVPFFTNQGYVEVDVDAVFPPLEDDESDDADTNTDDSGHESDDADASG